jgi:hypothetical protein
MKAKEIFFDFIHHAITLVIIGFIIIYFIAGDRFGTFIEVMRSLIPIGIFGLIFLIMLKIHRIKTKKDRLSDKEDDTEIVLYLNYFDRLKSDVFIFSLPIIILLISLFKDREVNKTDIFQATAAFLLMYLWQKFLFRKGRAQ